MTSDFNLQISAISKPYCCILRSQSIPLQLAHRTWQMQLCDIQVLEFIALQFITALPRSVTYKTFHKARLAEEKNSMTHHFRVCYGGFIILQVFILQSLKNICNRPLTMQPTACTYTVHTAYMCHVQYVHQWTETAASCPDGRWLLKCRSYRIRQTNWGNLQVPIYIQLTFMTLLTKSCENKFFSLFST